MPGTKDLKVFDRYDKLIEKPFLVPVPCGYITYKHGDPNHGAETDDAMKEQLLNDAAALWKAMDMLGITPLEAYKAEFSLNEYTYDELYHRALKAQRYDVTDWLRQNAAWSYKCVNHPQNKKKAETPA